MSIGKLSRLWDIDTWAAADDPQDYELPEREEIEQACRKISALQGPLVVMDCIGYSFAMKREVAEKTGKTVVLSRTMAARVISELSDI